MNHRSFPTGERFGTYVDRLSVVATAAIVGLLTALSTPTNAADNSLAVPLCGALTKVLPEVRNFAPVGVQSQLVISIANIFNYDGKKLAQVQDQIDALTAANCPRERTAMLALLKMKSLAEALR